MRDGSHAIRGPFSGASERFRSMNANKEKRKGGIILQVATLFAIGILATGLITFISQHARSDANVRLQAEVRSAEIATRIKYKGK